MSAYILTDIRVATMAPDVDGYGLIDDGAVVIRDQVVAWVGRKDEIPARFQEYNRSPCSHRLVTPALIDCHTHVVYGGDRATEFEMRLNGASYEEVARAGGGIISTVKATRGATKDELLEAALPRVDQLIAEGTSLIEVKSGYGLDRKTELRMLRAARGIEAKRPVRITTSFLGSHATPPEYKGCDDDYIDEVCIPTLKAAHKEGLVDAVDGFCECIAFQPTHIKRVFNVARDLGLPVKIHAEQLSNLGGAALAASYGALSADHIEYLDQAGVDAMAKAGTVGVVLPGAFYTLRETRLPPIDTMRSAGVPIALATDCNPGSSPLSSLLLTMNMGCTLFRLTPAEALAGVTRNAARALGRDDTGVIAIGKRADLAIWSVKHPAELAYRIGFNPLHKRIFGGQL